MDRLIFWLDELNHRVLRGWYIRALCDLNERRIMRPFKQGERQ